MSDESPTNAVDKPVQSQFAFDIAEKITKSAALVVAISYALGVLISNQYLVTLGVSDFASLKPKYIITGLWTIFLIMLAALPVLMPMAAVKSYPHRNKYFISVIFFVVACAFLVVLEPFIFFLLGSDIRLKSVLDGTATERQIAESNLFYTACLKLIAVVWVGILFTASIIARAKRLANTSSKHFSVTIYAVIGLFVCATLGAATHNVAVDIYNHIPAASGGGQPTVGRLILNKDGEAFWVEARIIGSQKASELQFAAKDALISPRSRIAKLYYEDEHSMVVQIDDSHGGEGEIVTMTLNKSLVDAFITDKNP
jgi:hypothetical protein